MNDKDLNNTSRTNWEALESMDDEGIDYSDIPPLTEEFFENATLRDPTSHTSYLITETPQAAKWILTEKTRLSKNCVYGEICEAVAWIDDPNSDYKPVGFSDPSEMIIQINKHGWPLYQEHDPGFPVGKAISAKLFTSPKGVKFVAEILGLYEQESIVRFSDLGVDPNPASSSPLLLDVNPDNWRIELGADPREVDSQWLEIVSKDSPLPVVSIELSHNAEEWQHELIQIGLVYVSLVWNPFVTTVANETAKDIYVGVRQWTRNLLKELASRKDPVVVIRSYQNSCRILFIFRGTDVKAHYAAHDSLHIAAAKAVSLIESMRNRKKIPLELVYEFDKQHYLWFPSYAILENDQLVSDSNFLIALEQHPTGLSIGSHRRLPRRS